MPIFLHRSSQHNNSLCCRWQHFRNTTNCVVKSHYNNSHTEPHDTTNCCVVGFCVGMHYIRNTLANSAQVMLKSTYCQCLIWTTADQEMRYRLLHSCINIFLWLHLMLASWHEGDLVCRRVVQEAYNVTMLALVLKLIFDLLCLRNR